MFDVVPHPLHPLLQAPRSFFEVVGAVIRSLVHKEPPGSVHEQSSSVGRGLSVMGARDRGDTTTRRPRPVNTRTHCPSQEAISTHRKLRVAMLTARIAVAGAALALMPAACGGGTTDAEPTTTTTTPADAADAYARDLPGAENLGCPAGGHGPEAEGHPGCVYALAFAGCLEGLTGNPISPVPVEEEFADEPALVEIYQRAVDDCAPGS